MYLYLVIIAAISMAFFVILSLLKIKGVPFFRRFSWSIIRLPLWVDLVLAGVIASSLMSFGWSTLMPSGIEKNELLIRTESHSVNNEPTSQDKEVVATIYKVSKPAISKEKRTIVPASVILPLAIVDKVYGVTGGFWLDSSTWFNAKYHNSSEYTITKVTIKIRLTDKQTKKAEWYQVVLGPPGSVIPPGQTVVLSADVGVTREGKEFFWDVVEMEGYKSDSQSLQ